MIYTSVCDSHVTSKEESILILNKSTQNYYFGVEDQAENDQLIGNISFSSPAMLSNCQNHLNFKDQESHSLIGNAIYWLCFELFFEVSQ